MKAFKPLLIALALAAGSLAGGAGCYGSAEVVATAPGPRLVAIGNGVWVVEDWPYAVYYYDGFYWRNIDGYWYRSAWYDSGFVRVGVWPRVIVRAYHPRRYIRYRARPGVRVRRIDRSRPRANVRDRRTRHPRAAPRGRSRDHHDRDSRRRRR